jgi:hypothetical protein
MLYPRSYEIRNIRRGDYPTKLVDEAAVTGAIMHLTSLLRLFFRTILVVAVLMFILGILLRGYFLGSSGQTVSDTAPTPAETPKKLSFAKEPL